MIEGLYVEDKEGVLIDKRLFSSSYPVDDFIAGWFYRRGIAGNPFAVFIYEELCEIPFDGGIGDTVQ